MYRGALQGREKPLDPEHPQRSRRSTTWASSTAIRVSWIRRRRAVEGCQQALGPSTLRTFHNLGLLYADQGSAYEPMLLKR